MRYLGGKSRTAKQIAGLLNTMRQDGQAYWEPFCGACWVTQYIRGDGPNYASDSNAALIAMWQKLQEGWIPPGVVSEAEHAAAKRGEYPLHLEAFIRFGCGFGGDWDGGYARGNSSNYAAQSQRSLLAKLGKLRPFTFFQADFMTTDPPGSSCLIYCDPPYNSTTGYGAVEPFDSSAFWRRVVGLEGQGHTVIVSEYHAPPGFTSVLEMRTKTDMHTTNGKAPRIERLFRYGNRPKFQLTMWDIATGGPNVRY